MLGFIYTMPTKPWTRWAQPGHWNSTLVNRAGREHREHRLRNSECKDSMMPHQVQCWERKMNKWKIINFRKHIEQKVGLKEKKMIYGRRYLCDNTFVKKMKWQPVGRKEKKKNTHAHAVCVENWKKYPKLSLCEECALETSEEVKSGMGSMGWKEAWNKWEEWGATAAPTAQGELEEGEDKEDRDWGLRLEAQMMEGWDTAEKRGGRGRHSSCPNDWLRDCLRVALDLDGYGVPSPCCPANRQLSTNLWEPMASWGSMWRWRRDIILGAVGTKQQHYQQPTIW